MGHFIAEDLIPCLVLTGVPDKDLGICNYVFHLYSLSFTRATWGYPNFAAFVKLERIWIGGWHGIHTIPMSSTACLSLYLLIICSPPLLKSNDLQGAKAFFAVTLLSCCFLCGSQCSVIVAHREMLLTLIYQNWVLYETLNQAAFSELVNTFIKTKRLVTHCALPGLIHVNHENNILVT